MHAGKYTRHEPGDFEVAEILHDDDVEFAIIEFGILEDFDGGAIEAAIADEDEGAFTHHAFAFDGNSGWWLGGDLSGANEIAQGPEVFLKVPARALDDLRIEADPGQLHEVVIVRFREIDGTSVARLDDLPCFFKLVGQSEFCRENVHCADRQNAQGRGRSRQAIHNVIDRAVAAGCDHGAYPLICRLPCKSTGITGSLGQSHFRPRQLFDPLPSRTGSLTASSGIQDHENFIHGRIGGGFTAFAQQEGALSFRAVKRLSKVILIAAAVLVCLLVAAVISATVYVRSDGARAQIEESLTKALKTPVRVTRINFAPWSDFQLEGITVPSPDSPDTPLIAAPRFRANYRFFPLLSGDVQLHSLVLDQPVMRWAQNAEEKWVWPTIEKKKTDTPKVSEEKKPKKSVLTVEGLKVVGASVELLSPDRKPLLTGTDVNANLTEVSNGVIAGSAVFGKLVWNNQWVFENATTQFSYSKGKLILKDLIGTSMGGQIRGDFEMNTSVEDSPFKAKVNLMLVNLNDIAQASGWKAGEVGGKVSAQLEVEGSTKQIARLEGPGQLSIDGGRFRKLDLFESLAQVLDLRELSNLQPREAHAQFNLRDEKAFIDSLVLNTGTLSISAKGMARFDGKLVLDARLTLPETTYKTLPEVAATNFAKLDDGQYGLDFKITGKIDKPKTDLAEKIIGGTVKDKVEDLISGLFGTKPKEKEKDKDKEKSKDKEKKKSDKDSAAKAASKPEEEKL